MKYKKGLVKWIVLSLIFWVFAIANISKEFLDLGGDSAQYIILAESVSNGTGYRAVNSPGEPFFYHYPHLCLLYCCLLLFIFLEGISF